MRVGGGFLPTLVVFALVPTGCGRIGFDSIAADVDAAVPVDAGDEAISFGRLCDFGAHVIVENGIEVDDGVGARLSDAVEAGCGSTVTRRTTSQDDVAAVDADSGRPLVPASELVLLGGGDGPHRVVRYLLTADTPLVWAGSPVTITERATGRVVAQGDTDAANDFILLQVIEEPIGGTLSLSAQGIQENGTIAAAIYFEEVVGPAIAIETASWFAVRWIDSDAVAGASLDDTYAVIESG